MSDRLTGADLDRLDVEKARAHLADRERERDDHYRTAEILRGLADDEEREALRIDQQVRSILALIERTRTMSDQTNADLIAEGRLAGCSECAEEGTRPSMRCDGDLIRRLTDALESAERVLAHDVAAALGIPTDGGES